MTNELIGEHPHAEELDGRSDCSSPELARSPVNDSRLDLPRSRERHLVEIRFRETSPGRPLRWRRLRSPV